MPPVILALRPNGHPASRIVGGRIPRKSDDSRPLGRSRKRITLLHENDRAFGRSMKECFIIGSGYSLATQLGANDAGRRSIERPVHLLQVAKRHTWAISNGISRPNQQGEPSRRIRPDASVVSKHPEAGIGNSHSRANQVCHKGYSAGVVYRRESKSVVVRGSIQAPEDHTGWSSRRAIPRQSDRLDSDTGGTRPGGQHRCQQAQDRQASTGIAHTVSTLQPS